MLLVRNCEAFDTVGNIGDSCFGGSKEAVILILFTINLFRRAVCAISTMRAVGTVGTVCSWQVNVGAVEWFVEILYLQTFKDGEDTTLYVKVVVY
jgi:hypothetical protein